MHLRAPSIDQGVHAFVWSVVFFLYMWLGALAIDVPGGLRSSSRSSRRRRSSCSSACAARYLSSYTGVAHVGPRRPGRAAPSARGLSAGRQCRTRLRSARRRGGLRSLGRSPARGAREPAPWEPARGRRGRRRPRGSASRPRERPVMSTAALMERASARGCRAFDPWRE